MHMTSGVHTAGVGVFRLNWRSSNNPDHPEYRLRSFHIYLPQPVAAALRVLRHTSRAPCCPLLPPSPTDHPAYLVAKWRVVLCLTFSSELRQWYLDRVALGPHLAAVIAHANVCYDELFQRLQVTAPKFQLTVQVPIAAAPHGTPIPSPVTADSLRAAGWPQGRIPPLLAQQESAATPG